jgi:hypothetical protein
VTVEEVEHSSEPDPTPVTAPTAVDTMLFFVSTIIPIELTGKGAADDVVVMAVPKCSFSGIFCF